MPYANQLRVGDMVSLEGDTVFDPRCDFEFCIHKTQNAELVEIEAREDGFVVTFANGYEEGTGDGPDYYTEWVPAIHHFAEPDL